MGWLTGRDTGTKSRPPERRRVRKCTRHGNAEPCWKCKHVAKEAAKTGSGSQSCPKCGKTMRGTGRLVCPGAFC